MVTWIVDVSGQHSGDVGQTEIPDFTKMMVVVYTNFTDTKLKISTAVKMKSFASTRLLDFLDLFRFGFCNVSSSSF